MPMQCDTWFDSWDELLHRYVSALGVDEGRVNYAAWKAEAADTLDRGLSELAQLSLTEVAAPEQRLALWLNLYNALVIAQVLSRYPIASIRPTFLGLPNWIAFLQFFSRPIYQLDGTNYSLNTIEHDTLRREFVEPRIHFALVCAAIGCPLLRSEAYRPERVYAQLEDDAQRFISNPDKIRYDASTQTLYCSQILKWYGRDFLKVAPSVPEYIQRYLPTPTPLTAATQIRYLPYDWHLNSR